MWIFESSHRNCHPRSLRKQPTFCDTNTSFSTKWCLRGAGKIPYWWHITTQILVVLLIGWNKFSLWHDQSEALPTTWRWLNDASSVWNFCGHFSDVVSKGNQWWHLEMSAIFSGYYPGGRCAPLSVSHLPRGGDFHVCLQISLALLSVTKMKDCTKPIC